MIMNYRLLAGEVDSSTDFESQVEELGNYMGGDIDQLKGAVNNLFSRHAAGGHLYHYKKQSIVVMFGISDSELAVMPVLARPPGKGEFLAKVPRESRDELHQRARLLERSGLSLTAISIVIEVSTKTAKRYLVKSLAK